MKKILMFTGFGVAVWSAIGCGPSEGEGDLNSGGTGTGLSTTTDEPKTDSAGKTDSSTESATSSGETSAKIDEPVKPDTSEHVHKEGDGHIHNADGTIQEPPKADTSSAPTASGRPGATINKESRPKVGDGRTTGPKMPSGSADTADVNPDGSMKTGGEKEKAGTGN